MIMGCSEFWLKWLKVAVKFYPASYTKIATFFIDYDGEE